LKLFQNKEGKLVEYKRDVEKKEFEYEKILQNLIEKNLSTIFPSLEFVTSEFQIENLRPDSIAFDKDRNSFVIIEYKNVKHKGVVDQGMSYYQLLQEKRESFVLLYHRIKGKLLDVENDVNWDEARVIFFSPMFTAHQKRASQAVDLPIELYEVNRYENDMISLDKIESDEKGKGEGSTQRKPIIRLEEYSEEDYLIGKYSRSGSKNLKPEIRKLWFELKNRILDKFEDIEFKQKKKYAGFYSKTDGSSLCTIHAINTLIRLDYSIKKNQGVIEQSDFVKDVSNIGHWGLGDFQSEITSENDLEKALPLIEKVYNQKILGKI